MFELLPNCPCDMCVGKKAAEDKAARLMKVATESAVAVYASMVMEVE